MTATAQDLDSPARLPVTKLPRRRRAAIYLRISKDKREGAGVRRQETECRERAEQLGWEIVVVYVDNDVEASSGKPRKGYLQMLEDMKENRIDAVIGWHSDRIYRRPDELEDLIKIADANDVLFNAVQVGNIDLSTASGRLIARLLGAAAKYETELKGERQSAQLRQLAHAGLVTGGGNRPFGYEKGRAAIRESEAVIIRELVSRALAGEAVTSLAEWLHDAEVPTVAMEKWHPPLVVPGWQGVVVKQLLMNPKLAGLATYKGDIVGKGQWPAIIDEATHRRLVEVLTARTKAGRGRRARVAFLQGLIWCGSCGYELVTARVKRKPTDPVTRAYACRTKYVPGHRGFKKSCGTISVKAEWIEDDVAEQIIGRLMRPRNAELLAAASGANTAEDDAVRELIEVEERLKVLGVDYADGLIGRTEFLAARDRLSERLHTLQRAASAPQLDLPFTDPAEMVRWWQNASISQRQALARQQIDRIDVGPHNGRRSEYDPTRVGIVWR